MVKVHLAVGRKCVVFNKVPELRPRMGRPSAVEL
jgi:hypothetical protein